MTLRLTKKHNFDAVFDTQKVFRLVLEAMSNPTRAVNIKEYADKLYGDHPAFLAVAMTLLDNEVSFNTCENRPLSDEIASLTLAKREKIEEADYIFVCDPNDIKNAIGNAKRGTLADPHKSAAVIIKNDGVPDGGLTFSGPGIKENITVQATRTVKDAIALRDAQNYEYPEGIDLIFISEKGGLFAVPRLVKAAERHL
jgi:alpha-D-ribose 1-methylphosphonate 5-triphosphate synthase subunit PhnH